MGTLAAMFALMSADFKEQIKNATLPHVCVIRGAEKDWLPTGYEIVY